MTKRFVDTCSVLGSCVQNSDAWALCAAWRETFDFRTVLLVSQVGEATWWC